MASQYQIDPDKMRSVSQTIQEEHLITLKDDSIQPPPTIATPVWQNILMGSMLGQPSSRVNTFDHQSTPIRTALRVLAPFVALGGSLFVIWLFFR